MGEMATVSKKRKFVADGVFKAELNEFLTRELAEDGYSGVEVRVAPTKTEIIIMATRTQNVLGEKGRRIRELTSVVQKRFNYPENSVDLYAEKVATRGLCAIAQAESLRYKLIGGLAVRRACYGVLRFIMESGAKGCEVVVSGKLRGQRAKASSGSKLKSCCPTIPPARTDPKLLFPITSQLWNRRTKLFLRRLIPNRRVASCRSRLPPVRLHPLHRPYLWRNHRRWELAGLFVTL